MLSKDLGNSARDLAKQKQKHAHDLVKSARRRGALVALDTCELCDTRPNKIGGHHWLGYDHPLAVWWVCVGCNNKLIGYHDGVLNLKQARLFIFVFPTSSRQARHIHRLVAAEPRASTRQICKRLNIQVQLSMEFN